MLKRTDAREGSTSFPLAYARSRPEQGPTNWLWLTLFCILVAVLLVLLGYLGLGVVGGPMEWFSLAH